ncbi:apolipoprotein L3-like [Mus caroli]|uniref:Apolipoprotein L3-like n=1 Tax=Mus caroli TaxID=10089 RepID=A0A6P5R4L4_MUSCR|nr:apolipoprotein L3-like [Mus caroli]
MSTPERKRFTPTVAQHLLDRKSLEVLQLLLTEEETWKQFVAEVDLSREEEAALRVSLAEIFADPDGEDEDELQNDLQDNNQRKKEDVLSEALSETIPDTDVEDEEEIQNDPCHKERFLDAYPRVKLELEDHIRKLHDLADKVDKVHRDYTISQMVATSSSAVSGVLNILGLALAPVTAGVSLALSATGLGLGAAAAVTSAYTSILENISVVSAEAKASKLVPTNKDTMKGMKEVLNQSGLSLRRLSVSTNTIQSIQGIQKCINAIQLAKANTRLANDAKRLMTTGKTSTQTTKQVKEAFRGTTLAMTKDPRIMGAANTGFFLLLAVISLVEGSKHSHEGAKSQTAAELQQQAWDLEQKLQELKEDHDSLIQ